MLSVALWKKGKMKYNEYFSCKSQMPPCHSKTLRIKVTELLVYIMISDIQIDYTIYIFNISQLALVLRMPSLIFISIKDHAYHCSLIRIHYAKSLFVFILIG